MPRTTLQVVAKHFGKNYPADIRRMLERASRAGVFGFRRERDNRLQRFVDIVTAYRDGQPVNDIADVFGATRFTINRYVRIAGLPRRPKHFDVSVRERVLRLYRQGKLIKEIATKCKVSQAYVSKTATEEGINRKPQRLREL